MNFYFGYEAQTHLDINAEQYKSNLYCNKHFTKLAFPIVIATKITQLQLNSTAHIWSSL